jgi:hypothetical protein
MGATLCSGLSPDSAKMLRLRLPDLGRTTIVRMVIVAVGVHDTRSI